MANIHGIEVSSEVYDLEDTSARSTATQANQTATQAGQAATQANQTATQADTNALNALREAGTTRLEIGDITSLETTDKTDLVSAINEILTIQNITIPTISLKTGYSATGIVFEYLYRFGRAVFGALSINNIDGSGIGTAYSTPFAESSFKPSKQMQAIGFDYKNKAVCRIRFDTDGSIIMLESPGSVSGDNSFRIPFVIMG